MGIICENVTELVDFLMINANVKFHDDQDPERYVWFDPSVKNQNPLRVRNSAWEKDQTLEALLSNFIGTPLVPLDEFKVGDNVSVPTQGKTGKIVYLSKVFTDLAIVETSDDTEMLLVSKDLLSVL